MSRHLTRDLEQIKKDVLAMGGMVEEAMNLAISALVNRRTDLAEKVLAGDDEIDAWEIRLEDECLKMLALHQPVAGDLRFIISVMKVNNDLERVGDLALNIAERAIALSRFPPLRGMQELRAMADLARAMVRESLDALVNQDVDLARKVCQDDEKVDRLHRQRFKEVEEMMREDAGLISSAIHLLSISRYLERIADHATNVAEDVVFMVEGSIIRHQSPASKAAK